MAAVLAITLPPVAAEPPLPLPWQGFSSTVGTVAADRAADDARVNSTAGVWAVEPSILTLRGYLLLFAAGDVDACPLRLAYLRPRARRWVSTTLNATAIGCDGSGAGALPSWWGEAPRLRAPDARWETLGRLSLLYHVSTGSVGAGGGRGHCIGRLTATWAGASSSCAPRLEWSVDDLPVLCDDELPADAVAAGCTAAHPHAVVSNSSTAGEKQGPKLHLLFGASAVCAVELNATSGRLPVSSSAPGPFTVIVRGPSGYELLPDVPLSDDASPLEAPFSAEDAVGTHLPGLRTTPATELPGARELVHDLGWRSGGISWRHRLSFIPGSAAAAAATKIAAGMTAHLIARGGLLHDELLPPDATSTSSPPPTALRSEVTTPTPEDAAQFATAAAQWADRQRRAEALGGAGATCLHWCDPLMHCVGAAAAEQCSGCEACAAAWRLPVPSELQLRLAGYATRGAVAADATTATQALAPFVLSRNGDHFLFVAWHTPGSSSRIMVGRSNTSALGPYFDKQGRRMDDSTSIATEAATTATAAAAMSTSNGTALLMPSAYSHEAGRAYLGTPLPAAGWMPPGGEAYDRLVLSVACGPGALLGDTSDSAGDRAETAVSALGETYARPEVGEPRCASEANASRLDEGAAMRGVKTPDECQAYCAVTPACGYFAHLGEGGAGWRAALGGACWLLSHVAAADMAPETRVQCSDPDRANAAEAAAAQALYPAAGVEAAPVSQAGRCTYIDDDAFTWGAKPTGLLVGVPGGSLFADAATLSPRGWARGPASAGVLAYGVDGGDVEVEADAASVADAADARYNSTRFVFTFSYEAAACDADETNCTSVAAPQLGARDLEFDDDGWPVLGGRGEPAVDAAAARGSGPPSPCTSTPIDGDFPSRLTPACARAALTVRPAWDPTALPGSLMDPAALEAIAAQSVEATEALSPLEACAAASPHVSRIRPSVGPQAGGTLLTVHGSGFEEPALCRFATQAVAASRVSAHQLLCRSPAVLEARTSRLDDSSDSSDHGQRMRVRDVALEVSVDEGVGWSTDGVPFRAFDEVVVGLSSVQPAAGPLHGGTLLTVAGALLPPQPAPNGTVDASPTLRCLFGAFPLQFNASNATFNGSNTTSSKSGGYIVSPTAKEDPTAPSMIQVAAWTAATALGATTVRCRTPQLPSEAAIDASAPIDVATTATWLPLALSVDGGQSATHAAPHARVGFYEVGNGTAAFAAAAAISTEAQLDSARGSEATDAADRASMSASAALAWGGSWSVPRLQLLSIEPVGGPQAGGTLLTLRGGGFADLGGTDAQGEAVGGAYCRFDTPGGPHEGAAEETAVAATAQLALEEAQASLAATQAALGAAAASVAAAAGTPSDAQVDELVRLETEVARLTSEAVTVGAALEVLGVHGSQGGRARVAWRPGYSRATVHDDGTATCSVPALASRAPTPPPPPGHAAPAPPPPFLMSAVRLTLNGEAAALSSPLPYLAYRPATHRLRAALPASGPTRGNTTVDVASGPADMLPSLAGWNGTALCRFGHTTVPAVAIDDSGDDDVLYDGAALGVGGGSWWRCVSPPAETVSGSREVALTLAINGQDFDTRPALRWSFFDLDAVTLSRVLPPGGPIAGGTAITLWGGGFPSGLPAVVAAVSGDGGGASPQMLLCRVGAATTAATRISHEEIRCATPPASLAAGASAEDVGGVLESMPICVSFNGDADACGGGGGVSFGFFDVSTTSRIDSVYPRAGPASGGTAVTIRGQGLLPLGANASHGLVVCRFGDNATTLVPAVAVPALNGSGVDEVRCASPPLPLASEDEGATAVRVSVSSTGRDDALTVDDVSFTYAWS